MGGEPLAQFNLFRRVVEYAQTNLPARKRLKILTTTNGTLLDASKAAFLADHDIATNLSFDGVPEAQRLRGRATFPILDRLLTRVRRVHPGFFRKRLTVGMTLVGANVSCLAESVRYFLRKGVETITVNPRMTHDPDWKKGDIDELDLQLARVFRTCLSHYRKTGEVPLALFRRGHETPPCRSRNRAMCSVGDTRGFAVDVDGQVYGCAALVMSYQEFPAGMLREQVEPMRLGHIDDPLLAARLEQYPQAVERAALFGDKKGKYSSYAFCVECRHFDSCQVCPVSIGHLPGNADPARIPDLPCAWNLVAGKYRERFPLRPQPFDWATGRAELPERMRVMLALGAARRARRAAEAI